MIVTHFHYTADQCVAWNAGIVALLRKTKEIESVHKISVLGLKLLKTALNGELH